MPIAALPRDEQLDPVQLHPSMQETLREDLTQMNQVLHDWIACLGQPDREVTRGHYRRLADFRVSTTDPDATMMSTKHLGYHTHYVVDGGKARIILAALVTPSEVMENQPMLDLLWRVRFRWKLWPRQVTGDTTYGTAENIVAVEAEHIRAYVPLPDFDKRTSFYGKREFRYDPERDSYLCPNENVLRLVHISTEDRVKRYQADPAICNACPLKAKCTPGTSGRFISRNFDEDAFDHVRTYHATEAYKKAMRKRSVWVEPLFAEGKDWHGMRRFRLRRLWRVNIEALMRAAGQNLKRLLKKRGWGRRPWPEGAVYAAPHPDWEEDEPQMDHAPGRKWARILVASMVSLDSTRRLLDVETGMFSHAVGVQVGAPSSAEAHSLNRVFAEDWAKLTNVCRAAALCGISSTKEFFNRLTDYPQCFETRLLIMRFFTLGNEQHLPLIIRSQP